MRSIGQPTRTDPPEAFTHRHICFTFCKHRDTTMSTSDSRFGFVAFAETWNGRLAMLGFVIGLATELLTGQGILSQVGLG
jgi:ferrochelatase